MISLVKNLKCISLLNIHYYPNHRYRSYITSLKAVIVGKSSSSVGLEIDRILDFVFFMIKYSKFTDNIGSGNFTDIFCQNTDKFQKGGGVLHPLPPHPPPPLDTPLRRVLSSVIVRDLRLCFWVIDNLTFFNVHVIPDLD